MFINTYTRRREGEISATLVHRALSATRDSRRLRHFWEAFRNQKSMR